MTPPEMESFVRGLEEKVWQAVVNKDGAALSRLFSEDYVEITLEGKRVEKTEIVELSPQVDEITGYLIDSERVVTLGESSVILSYHLKLEGHTRGARIIPEDRWATSIWSCRDGEWVCSFFQQSAYQASEGHNR